MGRIQQAHQGLKVFMLRTQPCIDTAHVVDHHRHLALHQPRPQLMDQSRLKMNLQMQPMGGQAGGQGQDFAHIGARAQMAHEVKAHAPHTGLGQSGQFGVRHIDRHQRDAQVSTLTMGNRILDHAVVHAVHHGLHDHATLNAQSAVQGIQGVARSRHRGDLAQRVVSEALGGAKHMDMRIAGSGRKLPVGCLWLRVVGPDRQSLILRGGHVGPFG